MAKKSVQRHAGAVGAVIVFLLVCGFHIPSAQAANKITIDGVMRGTTLETSRTIQAATEVYNILFDSHCYGSSFEIGSDYVRSYSDNGAVRCKQIAYLDGSWEEWDVCYNKQSRACLGYSDYVDWGTWDVVCAQNSDCNDGVFCNGAEMCDEGECVSLYEPACEGDKYGICDEENDTCVECLVDSDCTSFYDRDDLECVNKSCQVIDNSPSIVAGPFLAAGTWPAMPTSAESPMYLDQNYSVLWTFSDDYASCSEDCTHVAEYQKVGDTEWTALTTVNTDSTGRKYAYVTLPVESLQNATTYAFRFTVTDCAGQSTQSGLYYFRVATSDAPPAITGGPVLYAEGGWWPLSTSALKAGVLDRNYYVLWTFSDDYASCAGLCTHRARYRKLGDTVWTWITPVINDSTGKKYAYVELPVEGLAAGTYQFHFDVRDCAGQIGYAPKTYYFKVE